jgi:hypothetical protein
MSVKTIFQEGMKERRRRKSLGKVGREFKQKEKTFAAEAAALGRKAWEAKADLTAYPELQLVLRDAQKVLDDLRAQAEGLQKDKQGAEDEKKRESERLGGAIREGEEKKRAIDARLGDQKSALQNGQRETQKAVARLAAIASERSQLQNKEKDPATPEAEKSEIAKGLSLLAGEESGLQAANRAREEAGKPIAVVVAALEAEATQAQKYLEGRRAELRQASTTLDKRIATLAADLAKNGEKAREAEGRQQLHFKALGEKLAAAQGVHPDIAREMAAVLNARAEMEGVQSLIGGLERQKDDGQVAAYKKMLAILIGAIALLAAIVVALFLLLSPAKKAGSLAGLLPGHGQAAQALGELVGQVEKGLGNEADAEEDLGRPLALASEDAIRSALPVVSGWQAPSPSYGQGTYGNLKTASLQAEYVGPGEESVGVQVTDAGTAAALLAPLKMVIAMGIRVDDADVLQQMATVGGLPAVERIDKHDGLATLGIVYRDRYLVELKTRSTRGLELLREFAAGLDLSRLPQ